LASFDHTAILVRCPGLAGCGFDLHDPAADLGDLELEETLDEAGMGAAHHDLRTLCRLADLDDVGLEPAPWS